MKKENLSLGEDLDYEISVRATDNKKAGKKHRTTEPQTATVNTRWLDIKRIDWNAWGKTRKHRNQPQTKSYMGGAQLKKEC